MSDNFQVLKWAGGKRKLVKDILPLLNLDSKERLVIPFVGGGGVAFNVKAKSLWINDNNKRLIDTYKGIQQDVDVIITLLKNMIHESEFYYKQRELMNQDKGSLSEKAARFIYINSTAFSGMYRENSKGQFNVPWGKYKTAKYHSEDYHKKLRQLSEFLNSGKVKITNLDYKKVLENVNPKTDVIYSDSPYAKINKSTFTKYGKNDFTADDQNELNELLVKTGALVVYSNHPVSHIIDFWKEKGADTKVLYKKRVFNTSKIKSKTVQSEPCELIVRYQPS